MHCNQTESQVLKVRAPFTQDAEHLTTGMYVEQIMEHSVVSVRGSIHTNIRGFAHKFADKSACASCVNRALSFGFRFLMSAK